MEGASHGKNGLIPSILVGYTHAYFVIESTSTTQRSIQRVGSIRSTNDDYGFVFRLFPRHVCKAFIYSFLGTLGVEGHRPSMHVKN